MTVLCEKSDFPQPTLLTLLEPLLQSMSSNDAGAGRTNDVLILNKVSDIVCIVQLHAIGCFQLFSQLLLSQLRLLHSLLPHLKPLPSLPTLLSSLKASMALGLPGQTSKTAMASIHPPLSIPPQSPTQSSKLTHSVAGPQERLGQGKIKSRNKSKEKSGSRTGSDDSSQQSSDSESSTTSLSALQQSPKSHERGRGRSRRQNWRHEGRSMSSSDSDVSDSNADYAKMKAVWSKIRHQALSCLALVFQVSRLDAPPPHE